MKCLLPNQVANFKEALKDKDIKMSDLLNLDHDKIVEKLKPYAGNNAEDVATLFEEKRILKNRMLGIENATRKLIGSGKYSPAKIAETKLKLSEYKAEQQRKIFNP